MKVTLAILACLAVAGASAVSIKKSNVTVTKEFLAQQKFLFEIVYRIEDPLQFEEWIKIGGRLIVDKSKYRVFDDHMTKFYDSFKVGAVLPRGEFFAAGHKYHFFQALGIFNFFYYAKDWETFSQNIAWARINVNEGMFVYALTLALIHHPDHKGFVLPSIYEIFPQMFLNSQFIFKAEKFDFDTWNRQIMLEKELKAIYDQDFAHELVANQFYMKDWKVWQWWKLMGLEQDWHLEEKTIFRDNIEFYKNDPKYKAVWTDVQAFWMPVDYTRDVEYFNEDTKLSYFTEDIGWNGFWYYFNMKYVNFLHNDDYNVNEKRRGELWIYTVQQLLARYYMERVSQGLGDIDELYYTGAVETGYDPQLIAYNGNGFTFRKNYYEIGSNHDTELLNRIVSIDRRIRDIIDLGKYVTADGVTIDLTKPESIEYIGNVMQGNVDVLDRRFFGHWYFWSIAYLAGGDYKSHTVVPNVVHNFETMLRDPISYHLFKLVSDVFYRFKFRLPAYKRKELILPGVKIVDVEVSKLQTFNDLVDFDVTNLRNDKMVFQDGKFVWDKTLLARQMRLNHKPFRLGFTVTADKAQKVVVRTFVAPDFDEYGQKIDIFEHRENFFELDEFVYELVEGENVIKRSSKDFYYTVNDQTTYTELYQYVMLAYEGKQEYSFDVVQSLFGFPNRLILPHGWVEGFPVKLFFMVSPFTGTQEQFTQYGQDFGAHYFDNFAFGYPFDRKIESMYEFFVPNMFVKSAKIYHSEKFEKYYPQKYEKFGTFDYTF